MAELSNELRLILMKAGSLNEVIELLKADGQDETHAEKLWHEIEQLHASEGKELSLDEMDAISGGYDWLTDGCAATVEPGSECWGSDAGCAFITNGYAHMPNTSTRCPTCGGYLYHEGYFYESTGRWFSGRFYHEYICRKCGTFKIYDED